MECNVCKSQVTSNMKFCKSCGNKLEIQTTDVTSKKVFILSEGEVEVKTYYCTTLEKPFAQGYICVTNKRVIYYAFGESSKLFEEVYIDKISGINSYYGMGRVTNYLKITGIATVVSLIFRQLSDGLSTLNILSSLSIVSVLSRLSILSILVALFFLYKYFFDKSIVYYFNVLSEASNSSGISMGLYGGDLTGQGAAISSSSTPTNQTHTMMKELGAMILDLKNLGDHAVDLWKEKSSIDKDIDNNSDKVIKNANKNKFM